MKVDIYEVGAKLDEQIDLLRNKILHYDTNFIIPYDLELDECKDKFDDLLLNCSDMLEANYMEWKSAIKIEELSGEGEQVEQDFLLSRGILTLNSKVKQLKFLIKDWKSLELKDRNHIEVKNVLYKDIKKVVTFTQI